MDFLWHRVSEKEKEEIKKQAKGIVDNFSKKLSKVGETQESVVEREKCEREEGGECNDIDRGIMFRNAPDTQTGTSKNKDFIIAEKGKW